MSEAEQSRLSRIQTMWTQVRDAHGQAGAQARAAQTAILQRYEGAIKRYLMAALRDRDQADEVFQDFSMQFIEGRLRGADPTRGQFRRYLKTVLFHLVADHRRRQARLPRVLDADTPEPGVWDAAPGEDEAFVQSWREDLLARTWERLADHERTTGQPFHSALRLRATLPNEVRSQDLAAKLSEQLGKPFTAANVRQIIHRARTRFAELLVEEVRESLHDPSDETLLDELTDLQIYKYCKPALEPDGGV